MKENMPVFQQIANRPLAHCATLCELTDGTLLTAWFGGTYETAPDVVIFNSHRRSADTTWSPPEIIVEYPGHALGQPVFLPRANGELWLFFNVVIQPTTEQMPFNALPPVAGWVSAQPHIQISHDNGQHWGKPAQLMDYPGLMFRSRPLVLPRRIIIPAYDEKTWQSRMLISDDDGQSWRLTAPIITPQGNIHPCLMELSDGRLLAYLRTGGSGGVIWRTTSHDRGDTWAAPVPTSLPNPNSGIDLLRLHSGRLLLAFNNSASQRTPLCIALAEEDERWRWQHVLEKNAGEFSYPTLIQTSNSEIHIVYTYQRKHIQYARLEENWLLESEVQGESGH